MIESNQWQQRELPTAQILEVGAKAATFHPIQPYNERTLDFAAWINDIRSDLFPELAMAAKLGQPQLNTWQLDIPELAITMGDVLGVKPIHPERIVFYEDIVKYETYQYAVNTKFLPPNMTLADETEAHGQYVSLLHFIQLNRAELAYASGPWRTETVLHELGHAGLSNVVDVVIPDEAESMPYSWNGYTYRYNDTCYGYVLDEAAAIKAAAVARNRLMMGPTLADEHPLLADYRLPEGYVPGVEQALMLDLISAKAQVSTHSLVWEFAKRGRPNEVRDELRQVISKATDGQVTLEAIESLTKHDKPAHVRMLQRTEEAIGAEASGRVSKALGYS